MKRFNYIFRTLLLLFLTSFFIQCTVEDIEGIESPLPSVKVEFADSNNVLFFAQDGGSAYVSLEANRDVYCDIVHLSNNIGWLTAETHKSGDSVMVKVKPYHDPDPSVLRMAIVNVVSANNSAISDFIVIQGVLPTISLSVQNVTKVSATAKFNYGPCTPSILERGVIYGTTSSLSEKNGTKIVCEANWNDSYEAVIPGLTPDERYYAVAYATSDVGTAYSQVVSFRTKSDTDGGTKNLSEFGTANCYIVSEAGQYKFDASVKGNSFEYIGYIADVEVLWETKGITPANSGTIIQDVQLSGTDVMFTATGTEGNALIAVKNGSGTILWSWHIWVTDMPIEQTYINNSSVYYVLDRNIGAIRSDKGSGDQWKNESVGTMYQRGRKDPFVKGLYTVAATPYNSVEQSVQNPTEFSSKSSNSWLEPRDYSLWSPTTKTKYDPCPPGYRVATKEVFSCLVPASVSSSGVYFYYDGSNTAWYPGTPHNDCFGNFMNQDGKYAYMWVSNGTSNHYEVDAIYYDTYSSGILSNATRSNGDSYPVRCMKDDGSSIPPAPEPDPAPEPSFSDWYLTGDFNAWGLNEEDRMKDEGEFYVYRNLTLDTDGWICIVRGMWEETVGNDGEFYSDTAMDVRSWGLSIAVPAGTYDVYLSSDLSKLYFMTDGKTPDQAAPAPDPNPSPSVDWTSDEVISYDLPEHASFHRQVLKNIKYLHDDENFYVKLQASAALFKESGTNYLSVFIFDDTNGSGNGYYGWWNNAGGNIEYFGEHVGVFTGTDLTLTIGSTPIPVEKEEYGDSLIWTLSIPRSAQSPLETRNPSFAFMTMCDWDPTGALPDKYDDMLEFYPSVDPDPEPAPVETTYTVVGDIEGYSWNHSSPVGLMTKEDKFYVAKNIPFKSIQFKIVKTGGWDVVYGVKEDKAYGLNTEIPVSINHSYNICVQAPEGTYDVYFDKANSKVWLMEPGKTPGDINDTEKPGGTEGLPNEGYEWE